LDKKLATSRLELAATTAEFGAMRGPQAERAPVDERVKAACAIDHQAAAVGERETGGGEKDVPPIHSLMDGEKAGTPGLPRPTKGGEDTGGNDAGREGHDEDGNGGDREMEGGGGEQSDDDDPSTTGGDGNGDGRGAPRAWGGDEVTKPTVVENLVSINDAVCKLVQQKGGVGPISGADIATAVDAAIQRSAVGGGGSLESNIGGKGGAGEEGGEEGEAGEGEGGATGHKKAKSDKAGAGGVDGEAVFTMRGLGTGTSLGHASGTLVDCLKNLVDVSAESLEVCCGVLVAGGVEGVEVVVGCTSGDDEAARFVVFDAVGNLETVGALKIGARRAWWSDALQMTVTWFEDSKSVLDFLEPLLKRQQAVVGASNRRRRRQQPFGGALRAGTAVALLSLEVSAPATGRRALHLCSRRILHSRFVFTAANGVGLEPTWSSTQDARVGNVGAVVRGGRRGGASGGEDGGGDGGGESKDAVETVDGGEGEGGGRDCVRERLGRLLEVDFYSNEVRGKVVEVFVGGGGEEGGGDAAVDGGGGGGGAVPSAVARLLDEARWVSLQVGDKVKAWNGKQRGEGVAFIAATVTTDNGDGTYAGEYEDPKQAKDGAQTSDACVESNILDYKQSDAGHHRNFRGRGKGTRAASLQDRLTVHDDDPAAVDELLRWSREDMGGSRDTKRVKALVTFGAGFRLLSMPYREVWEHRGDTVDDKGLQTGDCVLLYHQEVCKIMVAVVVVVLGVV
jgi:hypothetical protein